MADKVKFELITLAGIELAGEADMVVVPGEAGNFGVLSGYAPVASTLRPGTVDVYQGDRIAERRFVSGGFVEIRPERLTILADSVSDPATFDRAAVESEISGAEAALAAIGGTPGAPERKSAEHALLVARGKLETITLGGH